MERCSSKYTDKLGTEYAITFCILAAQTGWNELAFISAYWGGQWEDILKNKIGQ